MDRFRSIGRDDLDDFLCRKCVEEFIDEIQFIEDQSSKTLMDMSTKSMEDTYKGETP